MATGGALATDMAGVPLVVLFAEGGFIANHPCRLLLDKTADHKGLLRQLLLLGMLGHVLVVTRRGMTL